ncbi:hypothetical protein ml_24 [Mollivirus sibericum]|uniref:hypothetical protein n=1 Tax=Mollivirus sibericum TaxID=1678078 RepID=UPI0006B2E291|nr:hypothetical protein ml_24 [Mollivirus sibericum]ALD61826.1 hypothetical protein ml_24 [Mollivirus sibericum]
MKRQRVGNNKEETAPVEETKRAKRQSPLPYRVLDNGRLEVKFGVEFVQIGENEEDEVKKPKECTCPPPSNDDDDDEFDCECGAEDPDDDDGDKWDYDLWGARPMRWDLLSEKDKQFLEEQVVSSIDFFFEGLNPRFRDYTKTSIVMECDMPLEESSNLDKDEKEKKHICGTIAERLGSVKFMSFEKGVQSEPPDFGHTIETRAWSVR